MQTTARDADPLASNRTLLVWLRTSLAYAGLGRSRRRRVLRIPASRGPG